METIHINVDTLYVPHDIIWNILMRLPVKSLLRFKTISKIWETTISDPVFARSHLQHSKNSTCRYLVIENMDMYLDALGEMKLLKLENEEGRLESMLGHSIQLPGAVSLLCCCDGLILLSFSTRHEKMYVVWNPSSRTHVISQFPVFTANETTVIELYGLYYDPFIDDYKAMIVRCGNYSIFYCRRNYWAKPKDFSHVVASSPKGLYPAMVNPPAGVYFDGALYWVLIDCRLIDVIVCYDTRADEFKIIHKPEGIQHVNLNLLGDHLVLSDNMPFTRLQMFTMKKDGDHHSWEPFATIDLESQLMFRQYSTMPIFLTSENEIILGKYYISDYLVVYNMNNKTMKKIQINPPGIYSFQSPYPENLISLI